MVPQHGATRHGIHGQRLSIWFWQHRQHMLGEDPTISAARPCTVRAIVATVRRARGRPRIRERKMHDNTSGSSSGASRMPGPNWQQSWTSG